MIMGQGSGMTQLDPLEMVVASSLVIVAIMLTWSLLVEGARPWGQALDPTTLLALLLAAVNASVINVASLFLMKGAGPVAQQCFGILKSLLSCIGSVAAFGETISAQQIVGFAIVITSSISSTGPTWRSK